MKTMTTDINPEIIELLKAHKIDRSQGLLCLLGIYYSLDVDTTCKEDVVSAINLTKIVDKDYAAGGSINWNVPLFAGQETNFAWVSEWIEPFGRLNSDRKGSVRDAIPRMKDFFRKYPEYRKQDVENARDLYFKSVRDTKFLMKSHKFIFDGAGAMKKSTLLEYCEKVVGSTEQKNTQIKGTLLS